MPTDDRTGDETRFLAVDLDLESVEDLTPLIDALAGAAFDLHPDPDAPRSRASLEIAHVEPRDADGQIRAFADALTALPSDARRIWDAATLRRFSIGVAAGTAPTSVSIPLHPDTIEAIARLGASLEVVVYANPR